VNIANFALGRSVRSHKVPQGQALAVVQIEATPSKIAGLVAALRKVDAIASVRSIELS
jgi:D-3-phosphoglycerate dehydrogenase